MPEMPLPNWSLTLTAGAAETDALTVALWLSPLCTAIAVAESGVPVAVKVTGLPARLPEVAVNVLAPAVVPSFHDPAVATPSLPVTRARPVPVPPPEATAKVTATPETGLPYASVARTAGAVATGVSTVADWLSPA